MQHNIKMYLLDISTSIKSIYDYLGEERKFSEYETNKMLRRAVERELEIIGEATNRILKTDPNIDISNGRRIVNLRNLVIHGYDNIDNVIIWGIYRQRFAIARSSGNQSFGGKRLITMCQFDHQEIPSSAAKPSQTSTVKLTPLSIAARPS